MAIGLAEFAERLNISLAEAKKMFEPAADGRLRGVFMEDNEVRVDYAAFTERFRLKKREIDARAAIC